MHFSLIDNIYLQKISDNKQRTRLADHLKEYGLYRSRYSGFVGELNPHDRNILTKKVKRYIGGERDSIYIIPLCDRDANLCRIVAERELSLKDAKEIT